MNALPRFPLELQLQVIKQVDDPPTLITLASMSDAWYDVSMCCWGQLPFRSLNDLLVMIIAIRRDPKVASYVKRVAFTCDAQSEEVHRKQSYTPCAESCSHFPQDVEDKLAEAIGQEGTIMAGKMCSVKKLELLPQILLGLCDARSYALPANVDKIWCESLAIGLRDPTTHALRCLCLEGRSLYELHLQICQQSLIIETHALFLYGKPSDLTQRLWPKNMPTFAELRGIKWIGVSIATWNPDDDGCNIFQRFREYDEKYNGGLEKVVVRVTQDVIAKVCEAYDECHWTKGIEWRLWDIGNLSLGDVIAQEFRDGTWCNCIDFPDVLGPKHTIDSLRGLAKTNRPTNPISRSSGGVSIATTPTS